MDSANRQRLARAIASARRARGLQQAEVARLADMPVSSVSRLETGHDNGPRLTLELIGKLALALGIYPEAMFPKDHPYHAMRMLRGRMNTHFLCLGRWADLPEIVALCLEEIHQFRPDIVGLSLLIPGDGRRSDVAFSATLGGLRIAPQNVESTSERVRRSGQLAAAERRGSGTYNVLPPTEARIPGCELARSVLESQAGVGTFWFALSHNEGPEEDIELHPGRREGVPWHVGDTFTTGVANLRGMDDSDHGDPTIAALLDRMERLEQALQKGGRR